MQYWYFLKSTSGMEPPINPPPPLTLAPTPFNRGQPNYLSGSDSKSKFRVLQISHLN